MSHQYGAMESRYPCSELFLPSDYSGHARSRSICMRFSTLLLGLTALALLAQPVFSQADLAPANQGTRARSPSTVPKKDAWRQRKDHALLFATNDYDNWEPLINPVPDADALAAELRENYGFEAEVVQNPTRERIVSKLREYIQKNFGEGDQLFIFFAGHGVFDDVFRQGYIIAKDSRKNDETGASYVSYDDLRSIVNAMGTKHVLLALDACFSGTFSYRIGQAGARGGDMYSDSSLPEVFGNKFKLETRKYITSGGRDYVPDGVPGHHSPFVAHLLDGLRTYGGAQGYLSFANVLSAIEHTKPEPFWGEFGENEPGSDFFFVSKQLSVKLLNPAVAASVGTSIAPSGIVRGDGANIMPGRPSIAVMGFRNLAGRPEDGWISTALSEWLTTELASGETLRALAGENVARVKLELGLQETSGYSKDSLSRLLTSLGAQYVVSGSYTASGKTLQGTIRVDLRLQNATTGEMISETLTGSQADLPELVARAGRQLRARLGIEAPSDLQAKASKAAIPSKAGTSKLYADGIAKLRAYDLLAAKDLLQRAVEDDPDSALTHLALARTWSELGYDSNAKLEAANATDRARSLSQQNQLTIEGSYRRLNAQWERAIQIYQSLWTVFPDEIDYALELARVQTEAGKGKDALATIEEMRQRLPQAIDDPRVDLQEAIAASSISNFKRGQAAAARGAEKATRQGARLLAAQAYWQDCSVLLAIGDQKGAQAACELATQASDLGAGRQVKARSLTVLATIMRAQGKNTEALELRQEALDIATKIGSRKDMVGALTNLANSQAAQGQLDQAQKGYEEAVAIAREIDDKQGLVKLELNSAAVHYNRGDYAGARRMYEQSYAAAKNVGDQVNVAKSAKNIAFLNYQLGDLANAEKSVRDAMTVAESAGLKSVYASSLSMLGDILFARGDVKGAGQSYQEALDLFTSFNDRESIAANRVSLARVSLEESDALKADALIRQAVEEFQSEKIPDEEASAREILARALLAQGKQSEAGEQLAIANRLTFEDQAIRSSIAATQARLSAATGDIAKARQVLQTSLTEASKLKLTGALLEIRLAQAEIESRVDQALGRSRLQAVEREATNSGYLLIAAKAARLQQSR